MTELPGSAAVGIEAVEWVSEGGGNLIIRITGRWRRRRPVASSGQATLVVEAEGRRHRFGALPEPPSLTGASPGMWQLRFSVPAALAPDLGGRTWLQFGTVIVPLPAAVSSPGEPGSAEEQEELAGASPPPAASPPPPASEPVAGPDPGLEEPVLRARITDLERDLGKARAGRDELAESLAEGERSRRGAEQRAHAEQALRRDLARQLTDSLRERDRTREAMGDLASAEHRIRMLEHELRDARRRGDEAEQAAAAAQAARERAERERSARGGGLEGGEIARLRLERDLLERRAGSRGRVPAEPRLPAPGGGPAAGSPTAIFPSGAPSPAASPFGGIPTEALVHTLRRELDARAGAEAGLRSALVDAEARLAARVLLDQRTTVMLGQLRDELSELRQSLHRERSLRDAAERRADELQRQAAELELGGGELRRQAQEREAHVARLEQRVAELERELSGQQERTRDAHEAIGDLRETLELLRLPEPADEPADEPVSRPASSAAEPPPAEDAEDSGARSPDAGPADPAGPVEPARLNDALARLRESIAPQEAAVTDTRRDQATAGAEISRPSLRSTFARLAGEDADAAGRIVLELLSLQRIAYPHPVSYDLILGADRGCVCVSVLGGPPEISLQSAPRPAEAVDFQVLGDPARIARLLTVRGLRRRFGRRVAKVAGRRERLAALDALLDTPLDLMELHRAGVRLDVVAALKLVSAMVDPGWTVRERFTLAHRDPGGRTAFLQVSDGRPMTVTRDAPAGRVATTIVGPTDDLLPALCGAPDPTSRIEGDLGPLTALRGWINRAQSG